MRKKWYFELAVFAALASTTFAFAAPAYAEHEDDDEFESRFEASRSAPAPQEPHDSGSMSIAGFDLPVSTRVVGFSAMWGTAIAILGFSAHAAYKIISTKRKMAQASANSTKPKVQT